MQDSLGHFDVDWVSPDAAVHIWVEVDTAGNCTWYRDSVGHVRNSRIAPDREGNIIIVPDSDREGNNRIAPDRAGSIRIAPDIECNSRIAPNREGN